MNLIGSAQSTVALLLGIAALVLEVFAFVDAIRHRADAYVAAGKRTKQFWSIVTGVSALVGFVTFLSPLNMLGSSPSSARASTSPTCAPRCGRSAAAARPAGPTARGEPSRGTQRPDRPGEERARAVGPP